jgi:protein O-mannosyl-transferase
MKKMDYKAIQKIVDKTHLNHEKYNNKYQEKLKKLPHKSDFLCEYAIFLHFSCKDYDKAEEYYKKAINADPDNAYAQGLYANF